MADNDDDDDGILFPPGLPEEFKEQVRRMHDRHMMHSTATRQQISRFFRELTDEHLETLGFLFELCTQDPKVSSFYEGFAKALLIARTGVWPGWDRDDNMTVEALLGHSIEQQRQQPEPSPDASAEEQRRMIEYRLARDDDGNLVCANCGMPYTSLKDRMVKGPDDCSGCFQKARWG